MLGSEVGEHGNLASSLWYGVRVCPVGSLFTDSISLNCELVSGLEINFKS
jgi:hypothetical protein